MRLAADSTLDTLSRLQSLSRPTDGDVRFSPEAWRDVLSPLSAQDAATLREQVSDSFLQDVLGGVIVSRTGDTDRLDTAMEIRQHNDTPTRRVANRATATLECLPVTTAALLCGWLQHIDVYDKQYYKENVREAIGYYHPDKHFIEVAADYSDPRHNWARNKDYHNRPEYSTTVHELGHALHYMTGLQIRNSDTLDNNNRDTVTLALRDDIERASWQQDFLWDMVEGYFNVWHGRYDHLRALSKHQKATVEEFCAIAFEAWITAPSRLYQEQPIAWRAFQRLV